MSWDWYIVLKIVIALVVIKLIDLLILSPLITK
jgi:hypothetical protein